MAARISLCETEHPARQAPKIFIPYKLRWFTQYTQWYSWVSHETMVDFWDSPPYSISPRNQVTFRSTGVSSECRATAQIPLLRRLRTCCWWKDSRLRCLSTRTCLAIMVMYDWLFVGSEKCATWCGFPRPTWSSIRAMRGEITKPNLGFNGLTPKPSQESATETWSEQWSRSTKTLCI